MRSVAPFMLCLCFPLRFAPSIHPHDPLICACFARKHAAIIAMMKRSAKHVLFWVRVTATVCLGAREVDDDADAVTDVLSHASH